MYLIFDVQRAGTHYNTVGKYKVYFCNVNFDLNAAEGGTIGIVASVLSFI